MTTRYWITYERTERRLRRPPLSGLWYGLVSIGVGNAALGVFTLCVHFPGCASPKAAASYRTV